MTAGWESVEKILCVRLDSMGDVLMTGPAIRALKEKTPNRQLTLLASPAGVDAATLIPEIDRVIVYEAPWMKATPHREQQEIDFSTIDTLKQMDFDAAVIFTVYSQSPLPSALLCYLAGIPLRLAYCRENPYQLLTDWVPETEPQAGIRHEVRRHLDLVATVGCEPKDQRMKVRIPENSRTSIRMRLDELNFKPGQPWVVLHPGATAPSRRYAPDKFATVIRDLYQDHQIISILTGSREETELIRTIQQDAGAPCFSLAGDLTLAELAALLEAAPLLISNNTGPVHLAASVGTPVVDLYALTNPQHTPWGVPNRVVNHDVSCKYCYKSICPQGHHHCLELVRPEEVVDAVISLLEETSPVFCPRSEER